jgi:hypothetical protein
MVVHDHVCMNVELVGGCGPAQLIEEAQAIAIATNDVVPIIASEGHVARDRREKDARTTGHPC